MLRLASQRFSPVVCSADQQQKQQEGRQGLHRRLCGGSLHRVQQGLSTLLQPALDGLRQDLRKDLHDLEHRLREDSRQNLRVLSSEVRRNNKHVADNAEEQVRQKALQPNKDLCARGGQYAAVRTLWSF